MEEHQTVIRFRMRKAEEKVSGNYQCEMCGKEFKSEKALCGHLRCHRDRTWRGIRQPPQPLVLLQPPPPPPPPAVAVAAAAHGGANGTVVVSDDIDNNYRPLKWSVKDKRGRKCIKKRKIIEEPPQIENQTSSKRSSVLLDFDLNELPQLDHDDDDGDRDQGRINN